MTIKSSYHNMAYEVVKTIAGRGYRYQVERVRDAATGKARSRWTYLGRVVPTAEAAPPRRRAGDARERMLDALERLLATRDFAAVTAAAIVAEAGFAHGTFYRHFRDKRDALRAALERIRAARGPVVEYMHRDVAGADDARAAFRAFVVSVLRSPAEHPALFRAYQALALRDPEIALERRERLATGTRTIAAYLTALTARGLADVPDPGAAAAAVLAMIDGLYREAVLDGYALDDQRVRGTADFLERAVFGRVGRRDGP